MHKVLKGEFCLNKKLKKKLCYQFKCDLLINSIKYYRAQRNIKSCFPYMPHTHHTDKIWIKCCRVCTLTSIEFRGDFYCLKVTISINLSQIDLLLPSNKAFSKD